MHQLTAAHQASTTKFFVVLRDVLLNVLTLRESKYNKKQSFDAPRGALTYLLILSLRKTHISVL